MEIFHQRNTSVTTPLELPDHQTVRPPTKRRHETRDGSVWWKNAQRRQMADQVVSCKNRKSSRLMRTRVAALSDSLMAEFPNFDFAEQTRTYPASIWNLVVRLDSLQASLDGGSVWARGPSAEKIRFELASEADELALIARREELSETALRLIALSALLSKTAR